MYKEPKFRLKNGDLTVYSFSCGHVQKKTVGENYKEMYMEHQHYHVKSFINGVRTWDTFDREDLNKARRHYKDIFLPAV